MRELTEGGLRRVVGQYALGELTHACRSESGFVNENWGLETAQGRYFLKCRHPDLRASGIIHAQHALVEHLRRASFPAPAIMRTTSNQTLFILDGDYVEVQEYIEHTPYEHGRENHLDAAARMLARYHRCVRDFAPDALTGRGELYSPAIVTARLADLIKAWRITETSALAGLAVRIGTHVADLKRRFAGHGELPQLVIHGDYYADNLLFDGDRIVGVVDYDKARWQPRVAELAEALIYFASPRPVYLNHLVYPGVLRWAPLTRFLRRYASGLSLEESEVLALPDHIRSIWLSVSLQLLAKQEPSPAEAKDALLQLLELADWARGSTQQMIEITPRPARAESREAGPPQATSVRPTT